MYLIKCKCGSIFTIKKMAPIHQDYISCPNCDTAVCVRGMDRLEIIKDQLNQAQMEVRIIPDDAKITVSFDA